MLNVIGVKFDECGRGKIIETPLRNFPEGEIGTLMMFTGLTDRNSKEIYEGDIVSVIDEKWAVMWDNPSAGFWLEGPHERKSMFSEPIFGKLNIGAKASDCEVIGNILQNGDLLSV
jgi:hypothetical protein